MPSQAKPEADVPVYLSANISDPDIKLTYTHTREKGTVINMSAHNSLIKPAFTKSVMGYNTGEVDKYVEHVSERYNSVCKENAELKRRLLSEGVRLREAEEKIAELENSAKSGVTLDKRKLIKIFDALNAEKSRFAYFIESVKESLNEICADGEDSLIADDSWEDTLGEYVKAVDGICEDNETSDTGVAVSDTDLGFYEIVDDEDNNSCDTSSINDTDCKKDHSNDSGAKGSDTNEDADAYDAETDNVLTIFDGSSDTDDKADRVFVIPDLEDDVFSDDIPSDSDMDDNDDSSDDTETDTADADMAESVDISSDVKDEDSSTDTRTPAQIAADLDFYTDDSHADGESYDPMTLAAEITSRNSRPKLDDFMKTIPSEEN